MDDRSTRNFYYVVRKLNICDATYFVETMDL